MSQNELVILELKMVSAFISDNSTNNIAEYMGFLISLILNGLNKNKLTIIGDSQLVLQQINSLNISKKPNLQIIQEEIYYHLQHVQGVKYQHHFRNKNKTADLLSNQAMDTKKITSINMKQSHTTSKKKLLKLELTQQYLTFIENDLGINIKNKKEIELYMEEYSSYKQEEKKDESIEGIMNHIKECVG